MEGLILLAFTLCRLGSVAVAALKKELLVIITQHGVEEHQQGRKNRLAPGSDWFFQ